MPKTPEIGGGWPDPASHERLSDVARHWGDEEEPFPDRKDLGWDIASRCGGVTHVFRYLQNLVIGEGNALPYAPPCVRIVTAKDGWKEDYALVYGFAEAGPEGNPEQATRFPEEAVRFRIYYGATYGAGGYQRVEAVQDLDEAILDRFNVGDFTDDEAEALLADNEKTMKMYEELLIAARDPNLNPEFAESANAAFYRHADEIGL